MKVKCIVNRPDKIKSAEMREYVRKLVHLDFLDIVVDRKYYVYGVTFWSGYPWYYILEYVSDKYPIPICYCFFEITEPDIPSNWHWKVREWNPETGAKRIWHKTVDRNGNVRQVRSQSGPNKVHYQFDSEGNYIGHW